ncbi:hypothetical protein [Streptomyces sp. JV184]|uniref:hypothetical protein n=1 Tax=Streptomyces sp. JV184 TaxID=858637 RepID=UPI002E75DE6F|nr:hypothetical protein [Streptomyces sp. JV184]
MLTNVFGHTAETYPLAYRAWCARRPVTPCLCREEGESLTDLHTRVRARDCPAFPNRTGQRHGHLLAVAHTLHLGFLTSSCTNSRGRKPDRFQAVGGELPGTAGALRCHLDREPKPPSLKVRR